jgi:hypothetical protein
MGFRNAKIEATIGGELREFKFGMDASEMLTELIKSDQGFLQNPYSLNKKLFYIGLKFGGSVLPKTFKESKIGDWIDEMSQSDYEAVKSHAQQCLGFTIEEVFGGMEAVVKALQENPKELTSEPS